MYMNFPAAYAGLTLHAYGKSFYRVRVFPQAPLLVIMMMMFSQYIVFFLEI